MTTESETQISWWRTSFGEEEVSKLRDAVTAEHISQAPVTEQLEARLAEALGVSYVVVTISSGRLVAWLI